MITLADIQAARRRLGDAVLLTPCPRSESLSRLAGCELYVKLENLQLTGSFKERGALNKVLLLDERQRAAGVIAASAGNHAQGVARAARLAGIAATIVMPENAPLAKVRGTRELGAEIVLAGRGYDEAYAKARALQQAHGYTFIHAFDDPAVIAGQGAIGLELLEQLPAAEVVVIPVGGGGLIAGVATVLKALRPQIRVIGVETRQMPAMRESVAAGRIKALPAAETLADGINVAVVGEYTFPIVERWVDELVAVSEEHIAGAIMALLEREKTLAEGAGAAGLAAVLYAYIEGLAGKKTVVVISGGNIDMNTLSRIIERGLETDGRLARLRVVVPDKPGSIATLANVIAGQRANIFSISQSRPVSDVRLGQAEVELTLETRGWDHQRAICSALAEAGFPTL